MTKWLQLPKSNFNQKQWQKIHECLVGEAFLREAESGYEFILTWIVRCIKKVYERVETVLGTLTVFLDCCYVFWNFAMDSKIRYAMDQDAVNKFLDAAANFKMLFKEDQIGEWNAKVLRGYVYISEALFYVQNTHFDLSKSKLEKIEVKHQEDIPTTLSHFILYVTGLINYKSCDPIFLSSLEFKNTPQFPTYLHLAFQKISNDEIKRTPWQIRYVCDIIYGELTYLLVFEILIL